jgi:ATP-binding cassette subfamily B protein
VTATSEATSEETPTARLDLRRMVAMVRPEWRPLALGTVFLVVGSGMGLAYPQAIRVLVDGAVAGGIPAINRAATAMLVIFAIQAVAIGLRFHLFSVVGERIVARLREALYRSLVRQEIGFFDRRRTGELVNRLSADTTVLQNTLSVNLSMALRHLAMVIGGLVLLLVTSGPLTLVMLAIVPAVALGAVVIGRRIGRLSRQVQDQLAEAGEVAEETFSGIRTVRSFAREEAEAGRYGTRVWQAFALARRRIRAIAVFLAAATFSGYAALALVLWFGGRHVASGSMTVGELASFLLYTLIVAFSLSALGDLWADFARARGASERVFDLLDRAPEMPTSGGVQLPSVHGRVTLDGVDFAYPARSDVQVLHGVDLELAPGEIVALVGQSGSGKSTIAALLLRLYDPTAGSVELDGHDLRELDPSWLRERIGTVSQEPVLFATSIADNIRYGRPEASDEEVRAAAEAANAHPFIDELPDGYATEVGERGVRLSGGQKQRVAIARALLKDPGLLILDEATSALDAESEHLVQEALQRLMEGRTALIIAHRLSTVQSADRVVVLDAGRIVQQGPHAELMTVEGVYRRLVQRQFVELE